MRQKKTRRSLSTDSHVNLNFHTNLFCYVPGKESFILVKQCLLALYHSHQNCIQIQNFIPGQRNLWSKA
jgi:hypothetical protein